MSPTYSRTWDYLLVGSIGAILFLPFLGGVHLFDWDEINFAECSREMLLTGDYLRLQIDYTPFFEKPPLYIWLQALSMQLWGINEYAARFPNALTGIATLLTIYYLGHTHSNRALGWWWVFCYVGSLLPHLYFKSGIIDPLFNLFIFLSVWNLSHSTWKNTCFAGIFTGLAVLTKGPVALLLVLLTWSVVALFTWIGAMRRHAMRNIQWPDAVSPGKIALYLLTTGVIAGSWFAADYLVNGPDFIREFVRYQIRLFSTHDAGHKGFPGYHVIVLLVGCFPTSIFALARLFSRSAADARLLWGMSLFWVVLIVFSMVQSKIVHYSSACYLPLTWMAAIALQDIADRKIRFAPALSVGLMGVGTLIAVLLMVIPWLGNHTHVLRPMLDKDPFALGNLEAFVVWPWWVGLPGAVLFALIIARIFWLSKINLKISNLVFLVGTTLVWMGMLWTLPLRIEGYSQRAAIAFYQQKASEDARIAVYGFKSYAHLFYGKKPPPESGEVATDNQALLFEKQARPVYIVCKVQHADRLQAEIPCLEIDRKNGFVFFLRQ